MEISGDGRMNVTCMMNILHYNIMLLLKYRWKIRLRRYFRKKIKKIKGNCYQNIILNN